MNKTIKILIVTTSYADVSSGQEAAGSFVTAFVKDLNSLDGIDVRVVYPTIKDSTNNPIEKPFEVKFLPLSLLSIKKPSHWFKIFQTLKKGLVSVLKSTENFQPDHILALWALPSGYWAKKAAKKYNINYSLWCLGSDIWSLSKIPIVRRILKSTLQKSKINFADGLQLCEDVSDISNKNCHFLASSRHLNFKKSFPLLVKKKHNLCFLGRWHENKGIDILLDSLTHLKQSDWNRINSITIAGGGPLEKLVESKVNKFKEKGLPIYLNGFVNEEQATKLISDSTYMLIPSRIESIPVIFSDAIQLLRPVIAMPVGDLPALINKYKCGLLSSAVNAKDFSMAISKAVKQNTHALNENLMSTREEFYVKQKNHLKFMNKVFNM